FAFDGRIQVIGPIPPDVELAARVTQLLPTGFAEVLQRIDPAARDLSVVLEVIARVEPRRRIASLARTMLKEVVQRVAAVFDDVRIACAVVSSVEDAGSADRFGTGIAHRLDVEAPGPSLAEIVDQRIHLPARVGEVLAQVPVDVEVRGRMARFFPSVPA